MFKRRKAGWGMRKEFIRKGQCIFCGRHRPEATFFEKPHTTPHSLGSNRIGFDVCDDCNHFFGTPDKSMFPAIAVETSLKEIFGVTRFMLNLGREGHENDVLKSIYFNYWRKRNTLQFKKTFSSNPSFKRVFLKQFKRGLYEIFLQEYHLETGNGLDPRFDQVRRYARYGIGDLPVWHLQTKIMLVEENLAVPKLTYSDHSLEEIYTYGFYSMYLWGLWFYLEVTPSAYLTREVYLKEQARRMGVGGFVVSDMILLKDIHQIDFTMRQLYGRNS